MKTQLNDEVRQFIVQQLACFDSPSQVAKQVKEEFDIDIDRGHVNSYNPASRQGITCAKKWKELFAATRKAFLENTAEIPIANQAYRLKQLNKLLEETIKRGNVVVSASLIEQASKEMGGMFTNRQHVDHTTNGESLKPSIITLVAPSIDNPINSQD